MLEFRLHVERVFVKLIHAVSFGNVDGIALALDAQVLFRAFWARFIGRVPESVPSAED